MEQTAPPDAMPQEFKGELHRQLFTQIPLELLTSCAVVGRRRLVFVYAWLWFYAGRGDNAFPSVARLSLECGMKERDIRTALQVLQEEGWIIRAGSGPNGTNLYRVRTEVKRRKRPAKPVAAQSKSAAPLPPGGRPPRGTPTPPQGDHPLPPGGTPPQGDPIKKPLNQEIENQDKLITSQQTHMRKQREKSSAAALQVTTADAVVTDGSIVVSSDQNDAPQRHDDTELAAVDSCPPPAEPPTAQRQLPDCAKPFRELLVEWAQRRRSKHPSASRGLSPADIGAIEYANALGVLQPFLEHAAASGCKSLASGYRRRCEQFRAGPAASALFEQLRRVYFASPRRVPSQSLPAAQHELSAVLAEGHTLEQLLAALAAEIRAQDQQQAATGFAPSLPDLARWLKARRFVAYLPQNQPAAAALAEASDFVAPIDPETGTSDPFAYHRHVTSQ